MVNQYSYKDYDEYKAVQIEANLRKLHVVWVRPEIIQRICDFIRQLIPRPRFGLCHGTRRGEEQRLFKAALGCPVLGTEISPTAHNFPDTIEWDFHETRPEWIGSCDFIYSNSLDHAYAPKKALAAWRACLSPSGLLIVEWAGEKSSRSDPFSATTTELAALLESLDFSILKLDLLEDSPSRANLIYASKL